MSYIEREAVRELVKNLPRYQMFSYDRTKSVCGINPDDVAFGVDKIQAADVAPVRHGRWIEDKEVIGRYTCSECGYAIRRLSTRPGEELDKYCSSCGSRMDKEG